VGNDEAAFDLSHFLPPKPGIQQKITGRVTPVKTKFARASQNGSVPSLMIPALLGGCTLSAAVQDSFAGERRETAGRQITRQPFVLRKGKARGANRREIVAKFRPVPHLAFEKSEPTATGFVYPRSGSHVALDQRESAGDFLTLEQIALTNELAPMNCQPTPMSFTGFSKATARSLSAAMRPKKHGRSSSQSRPPGQPGASCSSNMPLAREDLKVALGAT
jgi:hypothetical protein